MKKTLKGFTNLYELSKTLRFELKPEGRTEEMLEEIKLKDIQRDKWYHEVMKPIFDELHNKFIIEALKLVSFDIDDLENLQKRFYEIEKLSKNRKENEKELKDLENKVSELELKLRKKVAFSFDQIAKKWQKKYKDEGIDLKFKKSKGYEILTSKEIIEVLLIAHKEDKEKYDAIESFKGFFMYFDGFNTNRENYYTSDEKHTAVTFRIVNQNLARFLKNKKHFGDIVSQVVELKKFEKDFTLNNYQNLLVQKAIDDFNESVIGEINYQVNQYNLQKKTRLPKLEILYKQIGAPKKEGFIFTIEEGQEWSQLENLQKDQNKIIEINKKQESLMHALENFYNNFFRNIEDFSLENIYFNKQSINTISSYWFTSWRALAEILKIKVDSKSGEQRIPVQVSLKEMKDVLENILNILEKNEEGKEKSSLLAYFRSGKNGGYEKIIEDSENAWQALLAIWEKEIKDNFENLKKQQDEFKKRKEKTFNKKKDGRFIKDFCDAYLSIERMTKYHRVKDNIPKNTEFYSVLDIYEQESELNKYYNAFRNYISQKPYSEEKIKLNFETPNLLGGWSDGQEKNKGAVILKSEKRGKTEYYLGILKNRGLFRTDKENSIYQKKSQFSRLILQILKFQTLAGKGFLSKFGKRFSEFSEMEAVEKLQLFIQENYLDKHPKLEKVANKKYSSKKEFTKEVSEVLQDCYYMSFKGIDEKTVMQAVENKELFLFKIYNKDFSSFKKNNSKENIHTKYWKDLFSEENLKNPLLALNANGKIFFRKDQSNKLSQRNNLTYIDKKTGETKKVLEHRRYGKETILFHVPIKINFKSPRNLKFNHKVNTEYFQKNKTKIIGIDRGEKHLIYISVIDQEGNIIEQKSFNILEVAGKKVNFHQKLKERADKMMEGRKNWEEIGTIKNFKEGYLSHVVHEIYKLILKHNAIVVMEDLNTQFKIKRTAQVEYSLYKKFELALAKKLNHFVLKDKRTEEVGGSLNALQLTPKIEAGNISIFEKSKQWGILYYVRPNYTSVTDPVTGWRKHKYISNNASADKIKKFFADEQIQIDFNTQKDYFTFSYSYNGKVQKLCTHQDLERFRYFPKEKKVKQINLHQEFDKLLGNFKQEQNISLVLQESNNFSWKKLAFLWNLLNQIRNTDKSKEGNENDFLQSPVWCEEIQDFFDSRKITGYKKVYNRILPENGDANGAYNTARKGLILLNRLLNDQNCKELLVKDNDWDNFVQKNE